MKIQRYKPRKFKHVQDVNFQHANMQIFESE